MTEETSPRVRVPWEFSETPRGAMGNTLTIDIAKLARACLEGGRHVADVHVLALVCQLESLRATLDEREGRIAMLERALAAILAAGECAQCAMAEQIAPKPDVVMEPR